MRVPNVVDAAAVALCCLGAGTLAFSQSIHQVNDVNRWTSGGAKYADPRRPKRLQKRVEKRKSMRGDDDSDLLLVV